MSVPCLPPHVRVPCFLGGETQDSRARPGSLGSRLLFCSGDPFCGPCRTAEVPQPWVYLTLPIRRSGNYCVGE